MKPIPLLFLVMVIDQKGMTGIRGLPIRFMLELRNAMTCHQKQVVFNRWQVIISTITDELPSCLRVAGESSVFLMS